ncbi:hypothetical protein [Micromonospora taraxaci]|uniref:hypothetical protein n=1 Tax=Micromonospora taraxaci TaxID=1316803 RepID=UPI003F4CC6D9
MSHTAPGSVPDWVVEQAIALLRWFRRLRIRWEIRDDIHEAFLTPARRHHLLAPTSTLDELGVLSRPGAEAAR